MNTIKLKRSRLVAPIGLVVQYFYGAYQELRRVTWPTRQMVINYTILVVVSIVIGALVLTVFDFGLKQLADRYLIR